MTLSTQELFDKVISHVRNQGGHGSCYGYITVLDNCKCIKGSLMKNKIYRTYKEHMLNADIDNFVGVHLYVIEESINRQLTRDEKIILHHLERAYEGNVSQIAYDVFTDADFTDSERLQEIDYKIKLCSLTPEDRLFPPLFEKVAKRLAEIFDLKYRTTDQIEEEKETEHLLVA